MISSSNDTFLPLFGALHFLRLLHQELLKRRSKGEEGGGKLWPPRAVPASGVLCRQLPNLYNGPTASSGKFVLNKGTTTDHISRVIILPLYMYTIYLSNVFRILTWGDGYYNGPIKTRKTVQPMEVSEEEASLERSQQLRELYGTLSAGETDQPPARASLSPEDLNETEWFFLMCISFSFPPGDG